MTEHELSHRLRTVQPPDEAGARERTWTVIRAAHQSAVREPVAVARRSRRAPDPGGRRTGGDRHLMLVFAVTSAPRQAVARWVRDALGLTRLPPARPTLGPLPDRRAGARHHAQRRVDRQLARRPPPPRARRGCELLAPQPVRRDVARAPAHRVDLRGRRQWALSAGSAGLGCWLVTGRLPDRVPGRTVVVVVAGDGSGATCSRDAPRRSPPRGSPARGVAHRVAFLDARGAIELRDADTGSLVWRARVRARPEQLLWSADGRRLAVLAGIRSPCIPAPGGGWPRGTPARARSSPAARWRPVTGSRCSPPARLRARAASSS